MTVYLSILAGVGVGAFTCGVLARHFWPVHVHAFVPVKTEFITAGLIQPLVKQTMVLMLCRCGEYESRTIAGRWSVDDLTGKTGKPEEVVSGA